MNCRHASLEQETLNEVIDFTNQYIQNNAASCIANKALNKIIKTILKDVYSYAHAWVDVDNIVSEQNLLSKDVVLFPLISELYISHIDGNEITFTALFDQIYFLLDREIPTHKNQEKFNSNINLILEKYKNEKEAD